MRRLLTGAGVLVLPVLIASIPTPGWAGTATVAGTATAEARSSTWIALESPFSQGQYQWQSRRKATLGLSIPFRSHPTASR